METVDPTRCPLCGEANDCGAERGAASCWCADVTFSQEILDRVPTDLRDTACICQRCAIRLSHDEASQGIS